MNYFLLVIMLSVLTFSGKDNQANKVTSLATVADFIKEVDTSNLKVMVNEFTGERKTTVGGSSVTILNRVNGNDLAARYLKEKLNSFTNLTVEGHKYSTQGENIIATQKGIKNPNNIYILCAHYDAVANYCADDNASGTIAVLEAARILSRYKSNNTILYILFDQEEIGLIGSRQYVNKIKREGKNVLGVINVDMIGYDANNDNNIPIHIKNIGKALALKNEAEKVLKTHADKIGLTPTIVNPGIELSDHANFWENGYTAIMITEAATFNELTPYYHKPTDRVSKLNFPYFYKATKFLVALTATKGDVH